MDIWWGRRTASVVGAVLLTVGAVVGGQLALGAALGGSDPSAGGVARTALSPYRDGAFDAGWFSLLRLSIAVLHHISTPARCQKAMCGLVENGELFMFPILGGNVLILASKT